MFSHSEKGLEFLTFDGIAYILTLCLSLVELVTKIFNVFEGHWVIRCSYCQVLPT